MTSPAHTAHAAAAVGAAAVARPTLVFLPGLASDDEVWADVRAALAQAATPALAPLIDAASVADAHTRCASLPEMAATLLRDTTGPLVLVGHSMGGMVAQLAARQAPARITALALLGTSARADTPELVRLRTEACEHFAAGRMDEVLRANVSFAFHPDSASDAALVARYVAIVRRAGAAQLIAQNRAVMARDDNRPHLGAIRCPTLVLCGEADALTPPEVGQEIAAAIPGARFVEIDSDNHVVLEGEREWPRLVAEIERFLAA